MSFNSPATDLDQTLAGSHGKAFWVFAAVGFVFCGMIYLGALGCFVKWEEKAITRAEYFRRVTLRNKIYAPVVWLKTKDPSGAVRTFIQWEYNLFHKPSFEVNALP